MSGGGNRFPQRMRLLLLGGKMFHCHYMCNVVFGRTGFQADFTGEKYFARIDR